MKDSTASMIFVPRNDEARSVDDWENRVPLLSLHVDDHEIKETKMERPRIPYGVGEVEERKYTHQNDSMKATMELEWDKGCFFSDGKRQIDFVLAYEEEKEKDSKSSNSSEDTDILDEDEDTEQAEEGRSPKLRESVAVKKQKRRDFYERNLVKMGLDLERVEINPQLGLTRFVLVHAPFAVLEKQAQLLSVKLPVKESDVQFADRSYLPGFVDATLNRMKIFEFDGETKKLLDEPDYFTAPYSADRKNQFVNWDRPDMMFPNAERSRMVYDLLTRAHYDLPMKGKRGVVHYRFGIERLVNGNTYSAAYPLHQQFRTEEEVKTNTGNITRRDLLYSHWASLRNIFKYQPLDSIKRYFGTKVAFYFAWLGYYTKSLYLSATLGLLTVVYGLFRMSEDVVSNDICATDGVGATVVICPQCESYCDFQRLNNSCVYAKVSYLFDNGMTVLFAAVISVWATVFLEGWKRYHAEIAWKWGLLDTVIEEDTVRPEFQFRVKTTRFNPVTGKDEPYLSGTKKMVNFLAGFAIVMFFVLLVIAVVFGMVVYRVIVLKLLAKADNPNVDSFAFLIVSITAAIINLIVVIIMNIFYNNLAIWLTNWECPRTQSDYDNSYTFKVFLFQFVSYYSSLFYIAFVKGSLAQVPGSVRDRDGNVFFFGHRVEGCDPAGCFVELVIQLFIIMVGRQFISGLIEIVYPMAMSLLRKHQLRVPQAMETATQTKQRIREETMKKSTAMNKKMKPWEVDYYLSPTYDQFLFDEYLEMVLQFGFVTLFVAAFPLAPLFAVINNIIEIRTDAYKFLCTTARPTPQQAKNIGVWLNILDVISKASVPINAMVIAFTSDFVPKMLYLYSNGDMYGYVESSLAYFDATELDMKKTIFPNITQCRFRGYRRIPCSLNITSTIHGEDCDDKMGLSYEWWKVLAARLLFVVIFEHIVYVLKTCLSLLIPDVPDRIFVQQQREKYLIRKALLAEVSSRSSDSARSPQNIQAISDAADGDNDSTAFQKGAFTQDLQQPELRSYNGPTKRRGGGRESRPTSATSGATSLRHVDSVESFYTARDSRGSLQGLNVESKF